MWKLQDFYVTLILREINLGESKGSKTAIFTHLDCLYCDFDELLHFLKVEIHQINKINSP